MMTKEQGRKNAQNTEKELEVVWINYNPSNMNSNYSPSFTQWPSIVTCMKVTSPSQFSSSVLDNFRAMGRSQGNHLPQCWVSVASPEARERLSHNYSLWQPTLKKEIDDFIVFGSCYSKCDSLFLVSVASEQTRDKPSSNIWSIVIMLIGTFILAFRSARSVLRDSVEKSNNRNKNQ